MKRIAPPILIILVFTLHLFATPGKTTIDSIMVNEHDYKTSIVKLRNQPVNDLEAYLSTTTDELTKCKIYNALCWVYFNSDPPKAMEYAKMQNALVEKLKNMDAMIASYDNMSFLYYGFGDNDKAVDYMLKALKAKESINDEEGVAISISGLAGTYYEMHNYKLALSYYNQIYDIFMKSDRKLEAAATLANIGLCYVGLGQVDQGLSNYLKAVDIYKEVGADKEIATTYGNIGQIYFRNYNDFDNALKYYKMSAKLGEEKENVSSLCAVYSEMAEIYSLQNDFTNALIYAKKAVKYANLSESKKDILNANKALAIAFYNNKNYQLAYEHFNIAFDLKDSIFNETSSKQIAEMQTKYDTEKKETENNLLKAEKKLDKVELEKKTAQQKMLAIGLFLALVVVIYIAYSLNQKKKINRLLNTQNEIIEEKNKDITDSINYAQRIQHAILPEDECLQKHYRSFIFYKPKDIVSGDFSWVKAVGSKIYFSVVDCTGHGVPGAFMSIIGYNSLNRIVEDFNITETGLILDKLNELVIEAIGNHSGQDVTIRDGMDISICCVDKDTNVLEYSGAHNSLYLIRSSKNVIEGVEPIMDENGLVFYEIKPDKMAIGGDRNKASYRTHTIKLDKEDSLYLFSDGYADQFGGPKGKKFMYKQFKQMFFSIQDKTMQEQMQHLDQTLTEWKGDISQLDDICVIGVKI